MSRFEIHSTPLEGVKVLRRQPLTDARGFFERMYCANELQAAGLHTPLAQINRARTGAAGTIRGLHFQHPPSGEVKLVSCLTGQIFDVAVDLRPHSPTFLKWFGMALTADDPTSLVIPVGCAHGYQSLSTNSEILYFVNNPYDPAAEDGLHPLDPVLGIAWPMAATGLSDRDSRRPYIDKSTYVGVPEVGP
jgi:dTDP-4-dehydrorhamnose 3,5-epimerase